MDDAMDHLVRCRTARAWLDCAAEDGCPHTSPGQWLMPLRNVTELAYTRNLRTRNLRTCHAGWPRAKVRRSIVLAFWKRSSRRHS